MLRMQPFHYINIPLGCRSKGPRRDQCQKSFKPEIGQGERKRERDESESSEEHDFDSATTDARESVESAEHGGKPSS